LFIYDITLNDTEESFLRGIKGKDIIYTREALQKASCDQIVEQLKSRDFLGVSNDELVLTFKGRQAV
jgi:molybdopterin biosynthesis enzyme MoaB